MRTCEDCGKVGVVGLNGVWLCLVDFNRRLAREAETLKRIKRAMLDGAK